MARVNLDFFTKSDESKTRLEKALSVQEQVGPSNENAVFWKPTNDKDGNSVSLIRFLYSPADGDLFYAKIRTHTFKANNGRWVFENCPKTNGWHNPCPICEYAEKLKNYRQWKDIPGQEQSKIRKYFSAENYIANIYVIKDPNAPENEGKVHKYKFGKKILAKIQEALAEDPITGETGFSAFDPINGASFKLVVKQVGGFNNYDDSKFLPTSPFLDGNEEAIIDILENKLYDLSVFMAEDQFKSYDDLKKTFYAAEMLNEDEEKPKEKKVAKKEKVKVVEEEYEDEGDTGITEEDSGDSEEDIDDDYFKKLVDDM